MAQSQKSLSQSQRESRGPVVASKTQLRVERSILLKPQGQIPWNIHLISLSCSCLDSAFTVKKKWPKTQSFHLYGMSSVLFQTWPVIHDSHRWDSWTLIYFIHNSLFMSGFVLRFSATLRQWKVGWGGGKVTWKVLRDKVCTVFVLDSWTVHKLVKNR